MKNMFYKTFDNAGVEFIKNYTKTNDVTFVFECVDMKNDPHIIEYPDSRLYLLDVISNTLDFKKLDYTDLVAIANKLGVRCKEFATKIYTWEEFYNWYEEVNASDYQYCGRKIEGFVVEDASGYMVKMKLAYYNFWKFMRSISYEAIKKGYIDPKRTSALTTPLANQYYGWVKTLNEYDDKDSLPKDICALYLLPDIIDSGVTSLKIEGRMKSPSYVYLVVSLYKKAIDSYLENKKVKIDDEDIKKANEIIDIINS